VRKRILTALSASIVALAVAMPAAFADDRVCRGTIGKATIDGNVIVPKNATCKLNGTKVKGNVEVKSGAKLYASAVRVDGNIQSEGFQVVQVKQGSFVDGDVQLKKGRSGGNSLISASTTDGNLQLEENRASIKANGNTILGDFQAFKNTGGLFFNNNRISQNFQCKENDPAPTGSGNTAGDKEDQCAGL
jgi:hypothetical protein